VLFRRWFIADKRIFGEDAEIWRPERWLEIDLVIRKHMDAAILAFWGRN
jgi:hypothetical protein